MAQPPLHIVARVIAMADAIDEVQDILDGLIDPTRAEVGCQRYELFQRDDHPTQFAVVETWRDEAAFQAHLDSPHFRAAAARFELLLAEPPDIQKFSQLR